MNKPIKIAIIVPCYNEQEIIGHTCQKLSDYLKELMARNIISMESYVCYVDDGSRDRTWKLIQEYVKANSLFKGIKLSTNFGHQNALIAGLFTEKKYADCMITIDADLQDDITVIEKMVSQYNEGSKIVYGVRENRDSDTIFKRFTAQSFYRLMSFMKIKTVYNHADFRLIASDTVEHLEKFNEVSLFLRGIIPLLGFQSSCVYYSRSARIAGETKYPFRKMMSFAWKGITSFSTTPLRIIFYIGIFMFLASIAVGIWVLFSILYGHTIKGWASSLLLNLTFSGMNMICLGIIGEYIGKIYQEVKQRPRFIIEHKIEHGN
ncbi:MAG: glycosyltransferase family 2 protein [Sphingobacteriaceae bacterium]|nr:glycosyltransferase family 2 protein [Sphingobacteriaceae bacterium]